MELNNAQLNILDQIYSHQFTHIISGRQLGVSTAMMAFALAEAVDYDKEIVIYIDSRCFYRWREFIENYGQAECIGGAISNHLFLFRGGGSIKLHSSSIPVGYDIDIYIFDNFNVEHISDISFYSTIITSLRNNGKFIITSTGDVENIDLGSIFHEYRVNQYYSSRDVKKLKPFIKKKYE